MPISIRDLCPGRVVYLKRFGAQGVPANMDGERAVVTRVTEQGRFDARHPTDGRVFISLKPEHHITSISDEEAPFAGDVVYGGSCGCGAVVQVRTTEQEVLKMPCPMCTAPVGADRAVSA